jgi:hypothetical protein
VLKTTTSKQAKLQWLQNSSQTNGDNMSNIRHEASRTSEKEKIN